MEPSTKTARLDWFKWWPREFNAETQGWPHDAVAGYVRLLNASWNQNGLVDDERGLRAITEIADRRWPGIWTNYLEENFPLADDGRRRNPHIELMREDAASRHLAKSEAGKLGNEIRWKDHRKGRPS